MEGHTHITIKLKGYSVREVDWITLSQNSLCLPVPGNVDEIRGFEFQFGIFINSFAFAGSCLCPMLSIKH